ncbi:hypothetical protein KJ708_02420 [bacterium]|nr:hypothetical protein [bacterium]MBU1917747.1 hypothetical protein [bacterium]
MNLNKILTTSMEWVRPMGICIIIFLANFLYTDPVAYFHLLGPGIVILMCGTVAFEGLFLGSIASAKIGYKPNRAYQVQSALNHLATAITAILVLIFNWGRYADATIVTVMLIVFTLSGSNHFWNALKEKNFKPVNLMRPALSLILIIFLIPPMLKALAK